MDTTAGAFSDVIRGKVVLITGGTGSFGRYILRELLNHEPRKIIVFSRDEDKQRSLEMEYRNGRIGFASGDHFGANEEHYHPRTNWKDDVVNFALGDVRDLERMLEVTRGVDVVYHAAALKQVPATEFRPYEAVKTNVIGAHNVKTAAIRNGVEKVVAISTDKAVKPVNAMGMTKAIQEKVILSEEEVHYSTRFSCVRYGNIVGSRGSVVPFFKSLIERNEPLPITDASMTRFLLTLDQAIDLVFYATVHMKHQEIFIGKAGASTILELAKTMSKHLTGRDDYPMTDVGIRPGEKMHEVLVSEEEMQRTREEDNYFVIYPYDHYTKTCNEGNASWFRRQTDRVEYTSANTNRLDTEGLLTKLRDSGWIK